MSAIPANDVGGYANDDACVYCLTPTQHLTVGKACRACAGIPVEKLAYRASAELTQRLALQMARRKLSAFGHLAVLAVERSISLTRRLEDAAADRATQSAYDDTREAARAAFVIYPHLAPVRSRVAA